MTASAIAAALRADFVKLPVRCVVAGGDTLEVNFNMDRPKSADQSPKSDDIRPRTFDFRIAATDVTLKGPVRHDV